MNDVFKKCHIKTMSMETWRLLHARHKISDNGYVLTCRTCNQWYLYDESYERAL